MPLKKRIGEGARATSVESEIGRIPCRVHGGLASALMPKERIQSACIQRLSLLLCARNSYRMACEFLNTAFHRSAGDSFRLRTLADWAESAGSRISREIDVRCQDILDRNGFDSAAGMPRDLRSMPSCITEPSCAGEDPSADRAELFRDEIYRYNLGRDDASRIKDRALINAVEQDPSNCVYVSIDDVGVKHQKDSRRGSGEKHGKNVENTVIHIQASEGCYTLTTVGMDSALKLLLAFLLENRLLENRRLCFFSDGASNIRKGIERYFSFCPSVLMLDWYHLEKRMTELLSMALKGKKEERHEIRRVLDGMLWAGNADDAINYLETMDASHVKNALKLQEAIAYLERKRPYICCYALRDILGYRNSSNPAEKANDIVVAARQKHNGMSWSYSGSHALAAITAASRNNELNDWILHGRIRFSLQEAQRTDALCAA